MLKDCSVMFFFVLLVFLSCQVCYSQPYDHAHVWNSWTDFTRDVYLQGFDMGRFEESLEIVLAFARLPENTASDSIHDMIKKVNEKMVLYFPLESIRNVMTDLYQDPANSFISFDRMIYIARDKLKGESIDKRLEIERKSAYKGAKDSQNMNR